MKVLKYVIANSFQMIEMFLIGFSLPFGPSITGKREIDIVIFIPVGIIFVTLSYYYTFVDKTWKNNGRGK